MATTHLNETLVQSINEHAYTIGDVVLSIKLKQFVRIKRLSVLTGLAKALPSIVRANGVGGVINVPQPAVNLRNFSGVALDAAILEWSRHASFTAAGLTIEPGATGDTIIYRGTCTTPTETELLVRTLVGFFTALENQPRRLLTAAPFSYATFRSLAYRGCYAGVVGAV
jgi:hypothetical protein